MKPQSNHVVIVVSAKVVHESNNYFKARLDYYDCIKQSKTEHGRACGESVTWMKDGEIFKEYTGAIDQQEYVD